MKVPQGFLFSGVHAGIKPVRKDLALVYSEVPCNAAAVLTANKAKAAPCLDAERRVPAAGVRAVVVNSGNANALTGEAGVEDVRTIAGRLAAELKVDPLTVFSASTGVIGVRLPVGKIEAAIPALVKALRREPELAAEAIMTTDTRVKMSTRTITLDGKEVTVSVIGKGSGMIAPQLATMIAVVVTDAAISPAMLQRALRDAADASFNVLTIDGDMSTNDAAFVLANGLAENTPIEQEGADYATFAAALEDLCRELAREVAADGEGATKLLEVTVKGAPTVAIGRDLARSVAGSALVKAAVFGADPNWGRVLATVGARAGSQSYPVDPYQAKVTIQDLVVYDRGPAAHDAAALKARMRAPEVKVLVELAEGYCSAVAWGCDLSYDYVKINADYTSLIVQTPDGTMARDDRLSNYSPKFKVSLLVEALSYISRFSGKVCVIEYGGAAMLKESLKKSFADDINLLRSIGMKPVVVHGGGLDINRALEKLGRKSEFVDGIRVTPAADLTVVEMVLSGQINLELVTLLNQSGQQAVGLSGKDGALIRAKKHVVPGRDLGLVGEVTSINRDLLDMLLGRSYVPVISPIGMGDDGQAYNINADLVAAEVAVALGAAKLIYLTDVAGILEKGELVTELTREGLQAQLDAGGISDGMRVKARAILRAIDGGVERVHVIDGRTPHSTIAELFTDRGVGTLVTRAA